MGAGEFSVPTFVKWAGGKSQLLSQLEPLFPKKIDRYFEPFLGGGAVFFFVMEKYHPKEVFLSDYNDELITTYKMVQKNVEALIQELKKHQKKHVVDPKTHYYKVRSLKVSSLSDVQIAARFLYLNRTCFNGLYRRNKKGEFNVPMGQYRNPDIVQDNKLRKVSVLLRHVKLRVLSFEKILPDVKKGDFVYFDPPYYPLNRSSFTSYTENGFLEPEQQALKDLFDALTKRGAKCMESNSDTPYIRKLYSKYRPLTVRATRMINSSSSGRGKINEVVVLNY